MQRSSSCSIYTRRNDELNEAEMCFDELKEKKKKKREKETPSEE
jgi:hypothetical protein